MQSIYWENFKNVVYDEYVIKYASESVLLHTCLSICFNIC